MESVVQMVIITVVREDDVFLAALERENSQSDMAVGIETRHDCDRIVRYVVDGY
jgi:hypothetical protein